MFTKTRKRLTLHYVTVMMLLMAAFIVMSSVGVFWILYQEEKHDLLSLAEEEAREQVRMYKEKDTYFESLTKKTKNNVDDEDVFYYVFDTKQQMTAAKEPAYVIRSGALGIISDWDVDDGDVAFRKIRLDNGDQAVVLLCSTKMYDGDQELGAVFMGEDVSVEYLILKMLFFVMVLVSIIFLIVAAFAEHLLARKAMTPIKQAFSRQREFTADASHELRTPLSVLQLSLEAVRNDDDQMLSSFSTQVLEDMNGEIHRMTKLITDLLTLARADAGTTNILKEKFDLIAMAEVLIRSVQPLAVVNEVKLKMQGEEVAFIMADRERINQLLLILIDNAIKYTPAGGEVTVLITRTTSPKPFVTIVVNDTGEGISEKDKTLIFERFYRVDKSRSREEGGTGLGLSIAKWIVDVHGGTIKVESTLGRGSSFIICLPI
ncbi:sensor histidine kinase [Anaerosinus massiliensis]|uniref:sensor histidine kinase n=1 Tax=Massilibacillus massiliensis TaxID=1806837 RepID=UPI000DA61C9F|nr:ATP-binding protein [Massilibacillus massiliensis]